jgi:hypothetical protein
MSNASVCIQGKSFGWMRILANGADHNNSIIQGIKQGVDHVFVCNM